MIAPAKPARAKKAPPAPAAAMPLSVLRGVRGDVTTRGSLPGAWLHARGDWPVVLSFDVGKQTGWAMLGPHHAPRFGHFEGGAITGDYADLVSRALTIAKRDAEGFPLLVAVEDVFVSRNAPNVAVSLQLARQVGAIVGICAEIVPVVRVLATQWQSAILGKIRRDQGKKLSVEVARQRVSRDIVLDHEADAALLALYVRGG